MTVKTLRTELRKDIERFGSKKLLAARRYFSLLKSRKYNEATLELLSIPGFIEDLKESEKSFKRGEGVEWRKISRNV